MNRPEHPFPSATPPGVRPRLAPARPGVESLRTVPLLCAALLGAMLYGPALAAWQHTLVVVVLVAGGAGLTLRAVLESGRLHTLQVAPAPAGNGAAPESASACPPSRPQLRLITPARTAPDAHRAAEPAGHDRLASDAADPLTGSYSQHECRKMLALMFVRASRFHSPLALVMVRIEQLGRIGTLFGTAAADTVLVELAAFLEQQVRGGDVVARWDDTAFALLLPGTAHEDAQQLAVRLQHLIGHTFFAGFSHLSCAIGVASSGQHASAEALATAATPARRP